MLCAVLLLLAIGMWSVPRLYSGLSDAPVSEMCGGARSEVYGCGTVDDGLAGQRAIIKMQQDLSNAIVTHRNICANSEERAARTRRAEYSRRLSFANSQAISCAAVQHRLAMVTAHQLNTDIALTRVLPLNLPPEQIPYPFHGFW